MFRNPFTTPGRWFKANLHTHTTASDGRATVEERANQYRDRGYSVLAITDHSCGSNASHLSADDFLVMDGIEVSLYPWDDSRFYHLVCLNVSGELGFLEARDPNEVIHWVAGAGGVTYIAHPYWSGNTLHELSLLRGHVGIEVFNGGTQVVGKATSSVHWDDMLASEIETTGIAADDAHTAGDPLDVYAGWVMLKAPDLAVAAVLDALKTGCFYSSCGPEILDFQIHKGRAWVRCGEAAAIHLLGAAWHGRSFYSRNGVPLTEAHADVNPEWRYVRAEVVAASGKRAWANPILV